MLYAKIDCIEEQDIYSLIVDGQKVGEGGLKDMVALHTQIEARAKCVLYPYNERYPTEVPEDCSLEQCTALHATGTETQQSNGAPAPVARDTARPEERG